MFPFLVAPVLAFATLVGEFVILRANSTPESILREK
jgi:hypothetical protein